MAHHRNPLPGLLLLAGLMLVPAIPGFANDFYQRPPVPSSRNQDRSVTFRNNGANGAKQLAKRYENTRISRKIVRNIGTGNTGGKSSRPKASLQ